MLFLKALFILYPSVMVKASVGVNGKQDLTIKKSNIYEIREEITIFL